MYFDQLVDAKGLSCPMPLLKAKQSLNKMKVGERLLVLCTDASSVRDFHSFTKIAGHNLTAETLLEDGEEVFQYLIVKCEQAKTTL